MGTMVKTAEHVASAKPGKHRVSGVSGLYLKVSEGGGSWLFRYTHGGKRYEMGLGTRADVSIAEARKRATHFSNQHNNGLHPKVERDQARAAALAQAELAAKQITFRQAAESFLEANVTEWKGKYQRAQWWNTIQRYALPLIGDVILENIGKQHVVAVMTAADKAGFKETARRLRWEIFRVIERARANDQYDEDRRNPAEAVTIAALKPMKRKGERDHIRAVSRDNAPAIFRLLRDRAENDTAFAAWVFMIATATRPSEALKANWSEIDLDKKIWTVPAGRMKKSREHVVPLSSAALTALKHQAKIRSSDAVFPGLTAWSLSYNTFATAPTRAGFDAGAPHGWRSVFRGWANNVQRVDRELAEFALAHVQGATEGAYNRETAIEPRRPVMGAYAHWLETDGANVIPFQARA